MQARSQDRDSPSIFPAKPNAAVSSLTCPAALRSAGRPLPQAGEVGHAVRHHFSRLREKVDRALARDG